MQCKQYTTIHMKKQKIPPPGKEYLFLKADWRTDRSTQCGKSRALTKVVKNIISIVLFEQKCVIIKEVLNSEQPKKYMVTIGLDQSLSNSDIHEHRCLESIKKLYNSSGNVDSQQ